MHLRYAQLLGKRVRAVDGADLGRVRDLVAEQDGEQLRVTQMLVGPAQVLRRMGLGQVPRNAIPWKAVERIDDAIHLRIRAEDAEEHSS